MTLEGSGVQSEGRYAQANGTDIYYVEAGQGEPLLLLHGELSRPARYGQGIPGPTSPTWTHSPSTSASSRPTREGTARRSTLGVARFRTRSWPMTSQG